MAFANFLILPILLVSFISASHGINSEGKTNSEMAAGQQHQLSSTAELMSNSAKRILAKNHHQQNGSEHPNKAGGIKVDFSAAAAKTAGPF